ncbi:YceI family protein [Tamlana sp. 62-3]|uniref:YceI family protein n=1 Tax=Neotamlana sargassicola TaxID=2883125 RepID=A0A9X1L7M6_9FLAO|nr:YceI family protein [Tamlana sargassicola]MCB4809046.1 YceI family protein [Tamlana sargassicola]
MKVIILLITVILQLSLSNNFKNNTTIKINPESTLVIKGKTNVSQFYCNYNIAKLNHDISVDFSAIDNQKMTFNKAELKLNNTFFDCGNQIMNKDFRTLLKSKTYPNIYINLLEVEKQSDNKLLVQLAIELAGISKQFKIPVIIEKTCNNNVRVKGNIEIDILQYNLEPPKKLLGMVKVDNTINVLFNLSLSTL